MNNFDPYNVFLATATDILLASFVLQGHICHVNKKIINHGHGSKVTLVLILVIWTQLVKIYGFDFHAD